MEEICQDQKFWDSDLTWHNNSWPELTECFEDTVLTWVPMGYLLLVAPFYVWYLVSGVSHRQPRYLTKLYTFKQLLSALMLVSLIAEAGVSAHGASNFGHEIISYVSWIIVMIFHLLLVHLERRKAMERFAVLFIFWLLGSVVLLAQMYSAIQREMYNTHLFDFIMLAWRYFLSVLLFVLHCFSTHCGHYRKHLDEGQTTPYTVASIPSILLMFWMDPLVIKGFKRPLQPDDLYTLAPEDEASNVNAKFQAKWENEKNKALNRRQRPLTAPSPNPSSIPLQSPISADSAECYDIDIGDDEVTDTPQLSIFKVLIKTFWAPLLFVQFGQLARPLEMILNPFILGFFIDYIGNDELTWHGFVYTGIILCLKIFVICVAFPSGYLISIVSLRMQTATMGAIFNKSLTVSPESRKESTTGEIMNLMSVDATNVKMMFDYIFWMWMSIIYFVVGIGLTLRMVGLAILPGLGVVTLVFLVNLFLLHKLHVYQDALMEVRDERVKIMNEILSGIKVIKLYGWEETFMSKIREIREQELNIESKASILHAFFNCTWRGAMFWMNYSILITFVLHTCPDHYLDAKTTFVTLCYINLVKLAVNIIPMVGQQFVKGSSSVQRINRFLNSDDINRTNLERDTSDDLAVRIQNGDFAWTKCSRVVLKGIDLEVYPGQLIAVVGTVGAGKSSLLAAMLGELHRVRGQVNLNSSVAYVPQQPWVQNATVQDNILFGSTFKRSLYDEVIEACALEADFDIMPIGDQTEIGDKGINLSGGQKQRISLARALYSQADIYLLDDPLSAVDSLVGKHIFDQAIGPNGCLRGKTRILVTHGVQWLEAVDQIIVMDDGHISEIGTMEELLSQHGDFSRFLTQFFVQHGDLDEKKVEELEKADLKKRRATFHQLMRQPSKTDDADFGDWDLGRESVYKADFSRMNSTVCDNRATTFGSRRTLAFSMGSVMNISHDMDGRASTVAELLTTEEEAAGGRVSNKLYWYLWKDLGLGYTIIISILILIYHALFNYGNYWISQWNDDQDLANFTTLPANSTDRFDKNMSFIVTYTAIGFFLTVAVLTFSLLLFIRHITVCRKFHEKLLQSVMHAPMSFFDTTPAGRLLNRFSQDIQTIDSDIYLDMNDVVDFFLRGIGVLITIGITLPWFLGVIVPVLALILGIQRLYVVNSCQARRIASNKRSPIYTHFGEVLSGTSVIRAYQAQQQFVDQSNEKIEDCQKAAGAGAGFHRWMYSRLNMVAIVVIASVCLFATLSRDELTPGIIGLTVSYAFETALIFCLGFEMFGMLETNIVSVERVKEYSKIKPEAPWTIKDEPIPKGGKPWPHHGYIEFSNYSTRYRRGLDLVLRDVSFVVKGGEKCGIVGRTGAGKSSMVLSLFRLIEPVKGKIFIDGVDITKIGLHTLRQNITILPQDPVLFAGSLRSNIDPMGDKSDDEIWTALEHSYLDEFVSDLPDGLDHGVGEGGENLSLGQRQLLCLARTLLRKTKILVLDEATASVDMDTDDLIQKTIRTKFRDCTVFTIAHRLNTIIDYDRIMVLEKGTIKEFNTPSVLLADENSEFYSMAKEAGLVS